MTQAPATPSLVERVKEASYGAAQSYLKSTPWRGALRGDAFLAGVAWVISDPGFAALEAQQARIAELEGENEQLRLAICGGEDAPGYASSLPLETILKVCADNHATARRDSQMAWNGDTATSWRSCAEEAQALADRYEKALMWIALFAEVRGSDSDRTFAKVARGAVQTIAEHSRQALSSQGRHEGGEG